jgi:uncharacterized membrane protein
VLKFAYSILFLAFVSVSCVPTECSQETETFTFSNTPSKQRFEGVLIYGDELHEFKDSKTKEVYFVKDNSHTIHKILDSLSSVDYQPMMVKIEIDSIGLPKYGNSLKYQHVLYLHKIINIKEEIEKKSDTSKDTSIVNDADAISFKAMGNEPFWSIHIKEKEISFSTNIGQSERFIYKNAQRYHKSNIIDIVNDSNNKIYIIISDEPCFDSMSGKNFGNRVKLIYNDSLTYYGCGNFVKNKK